MQYLIDSARLMSVNMTVNNPEIEISPPNYNEVCTIINKLKKSKAGGTDNIIPELIKQGGRTLKQKLHKLLIMTWEDEQLSDQWNEGIICPVYKKGDRLNCTNYRPITLLNITYRIFAIILNKRLTLIIEEELSDFQFVFRQNRSTIDNIFMIRQIARNVMSMARIFMTCHIFIATCYFNLNSI
jgi:hypothetical protein